MAELTQNLLTGGGATKEDVEDNKPFEPLLGMRPSGGVRQPTAEQMQPSVSELQPAELQPAEQQPAELQMPPMSDEPNRMNSAIDKMQRSFDLSSQAGQEFANAEAKYIEQGTKLAEQRAAQRQQELDQRQQILQEREFEMSESQNDYLKAKEEAGQGYWENRSTGAKIGAAIAQALGAYSAAMTGTQNFAAQIIESAVKNDTELKLRKARLAKDRSSDIAKRYDFLMNNLQDESAVKDAMMSDGLRAVQSRINQVAAKTKSKDARAKALASSGELDMRIATLNGNAAQAASDKQEKMREYLVPEFNNQMATSKEGAKKINSLAASVNTANDGLDRLLEIADLPAATITPELRAEAQTTAGLLMGALREPIVGPGAVSDAERALLEKAIADPTVIFSLGSKNKRSLQTLKQRLAVNLEQTAKAYGIDVGSTTKIKSAAGQNAVRGTGGIWRLQ